MTSQALALSHQVHERIDPAILYWGTPVVLVSTENVDGSFNLAPISSVFWLGAAATMGFGKSSHTLANLTRTRECVLILPDEAQVHAVNRLALTTGAAEPNPWKRANGYQHVKDKFALSGLTPEASDTVAPPRARECPVAMEATIESIHITSFATVQVDVQAVHVHEHLRLDGHPNRIDPDRWRPLIMSFQRFYGLGDGQLQLSRLASIDEEAYR